MSTPVSLIALGSVAAIHLVAGLTQRGDSRERRMASLLVLPLGAPVVFAKSRWFESSDVGSVNLMTFALVALLVATLGRPARIVDLSFAGTDEERQDQRRRRQVRLTQYAFICLAILGPTVDAINGWAIFD